MEKGDEIQGVAAPQGVVMSQPAQQGVVDAAWSLGPAHAMPSPWKKLESLI